MQDSKAFSEYFALLLGIPDQKIDGQDFLFREKLSGEKGTVNQDVAFSSAFLVAKPYSWDRFRSFRNFAKKVRIHRIFSGTFPIAETLLGGWIP